MWRRGPSEERLPSLASLIRFQINIDELQSDYGKLFTDNSLELLSRDPLRLVIIVPEVEGCAVALVDKDLVDGEAVDNPADVHVHLLLVCFECEFPVLDGSC